MNHFVCKWVGNKLSHTFFWKPYILQRIHFEDVLIKYKMKYKFKNNNFLFLKCFKSRLCFFKNLEFLKFHFISAKIKILQIYL